MTPLLIALLACAGSEPSTGSDPDTSATDGGSVSDGGASPGDGGASGDGGGDGGDDGDGGADGEADSWAFADRVTGLGVVTDMLVLEDGSLLVAQQTGEVSHVDVDSGEVLDEVLIPTRIEYGSEGLLSIALDPAFGDGEHDWLYAWWTSAAAETNSLSRWSFGLDPMVLEGRTDLLDIPKEVADFTHNGGDLMWWQPPDSDPSARPYLYLSTGDGSPTTESPAQDPGSLLGKLLGFQVDPTTGELSGLPDAPYDEPFVQAVGLRNPWRLTDCGEALCLADPGHETIDEIDVFTTPGTDYCWPTFEGPGDGSCEDPVLWWDDEEGATLAGREESGEPCKSSLVGFVGSEEGLGGVLADKLVYGDYCIGFIRGRGIEADGSLRDDDLLLTVQKSITSIVEAPGGRVFAGLTTGAIMELVVEERAPSIGDPGLALSDTTWGELEHDYAVRYPLWSNGAEKSRHLSLPEGETIDTSGEAWVFPVGARLSKDFRMDGELVETRVMEKTEDGWAFGVFVYTGDEAALSDGNGVHLELDSGPYEVPSTTDCDTCHGAASDGVLGLEAVQLDADMLATLSPLLSTPPTEVVEIDPDPVTAAARGALHANCAFCHAGLEGESTIDLRWSVPEPDMGLIGQRAAALPDLENKLLVFPGQPEDSALVEVLSTLQMPPLAVWVLDADTITAVAAWISAMEAKGD